MEIELEQQIDLMEKELSRLLSWVKSVESRMSWVLPLATAMLGAIAILAPTFSKWTILPAITTAFAILFLVLSVVFSALSSFPRTTGPKGSLIYFGGIVSKELEQYEKDIKSLSKEDYIDDLIRQCHRNAQVAERKYAWMQRALGCLFIASAPLGYYCLSSLQFKSLDMSLSDNINNDVQNIIDTLWSLRKGRIVPSTNDVALSGGAVELDATFLYADLASSSKMAKELDRRVAAKIMKSFLATSCRLINSLGGTIQSFDGDRVMGVFVGNTKNSDAAKCALQINYVVKEIIKPKFENKYQRVRDASFYIRHGVGVDTGTVITVRAGARGANDLIWIGRAPNLAAKLSDLRESPYHTFITASVYNRLMESSKYGGNPKKDMWEKRNWEFLGDNISVYRSKWHWKP